MAKDNPETNPINIKPETVSNIAEQFSWVPLPWCSPPRCLLPIKSLALSAHISAVNYFPSVRQEPTLGALEGAPLPTTGNHEGTPIFLGAVIWTAQGSPGPALLPTDLTQRLQLGPVCPWFPPDVDDWPECPNQVRNKRFC